MPLYQRKVALSETDATGILYFTNLLKYATEAFEIFLEERGFSLSASLQDGEYLLPIVEAKANYLRPLTLGDIFTMQLEMEKMGQKSLHIRTLFVKEGVRVGETRVVHVLVSKKTKKSLSIPEEVRQQLCPRCTAP